MKKILVLEDDRLLAKTLKLGLSRVDVGVRLVHDLPSFYRVIENKQPDLCVMDRMIGEQDSLDAVDYLREISPQTKVLMLTKKSAVEDRINGFEGGADDYLPKPFSLAELRLRVRSLLHLYRNPEEEKGVRLGEVVFYPRQGLVVTPEGKVPLRKREAEILLCLSRSPSVIVPKQTIVRSLWPETFEPHPTTVDVYIRRMRQKLGKYQSIVETRRGFGYRLVAFEGE